MERVVAEGAADCGSGESARRAGEGGTKRRTGARGGVEGFSEEAISRHFAHGDGEDPVVDLQQRGGAESARRKREDGLTGLAKSSAQFPNTDLPLMRGGSFPIELPEANAIQTGGEGQRRVGEGWLACRVRSGASVRLALG